VDEAAVQDVPAGGVERHRMGPLTQVEGACAVIDVVQGQVADLKAGDSVDETEDAERALVGVSVRAGGPPAEQGTLLLPQDSLADEPGGLLGRQVLRVTPDGHGTPLPMNMGQRI
jgi:hypothetical protein